jgi:hypothetical protein
MERKNLVTDFIDVFLGLCFTKHGLVDPDTLRWYAGRCREQLLSSILSCSLVFVHYRPLLKRKSQRRRYPFHI